MRYRTRFVIVTDYNELLAVDTKTGENLMIPIRDIDQHFTFFLPWAGMEKAQYVTEAHADVKAAERMGKLFDELLAANPGLMEKPLGRHALNVFFTRLLFCFFAEDTGIFKEGQFTDAVGSRTQADGSDVDDFLTRPVHGPGHGGSRRQADASGLVPLRQRPPVHGRPGALGTVLHQGRS